MFRLTVEDSSNVFFLTIYLSNFSRSCATLLNSTSSLTAMIPSRSWAITLAVWPASLHRRPMALWQNTCLTGTLCKAAQWLVFLSMHRHKRQQSTLHSFLSRKPYKVVSCQQNINFARDQFNWTYLSFSKKKNPNVLEKCSPKCGAKRCNIPKLSQWVGCLRGFLFVLSHVPMFTFQSPVRFCKNYAILRPNQMDTWNV